MLFVAITSIFISGSAVFYSNSVTASDALPAAQAAALPGARLAGQGVLRFWGLEIYKARLWVQPGFDAAQFAAHPLALELTYRRSFAASAIAERSIEEMRRQGPIDDAVAAQWQQALRAALSDVQAGDRITGLHRPGRGVQFYYNGQPHGVVENAEFSRRFFGIWLAPQTSEPDLRQALLAQGRTAAP
jgi:hypothetical protein